MDRSESHSAAEDRLRSAREERDRRSEQYNAARGSPRELGAFTELHAAVDRFAAREAWLEWVERDD